MKNGMYYYKKEGETHWYFNDQLHRENGPAITWSDGSISWYLNGLKHRENEPACIFRGTNGSEQWWFEGKLHREDGPAIERINGNKEWWLYGNNVSEEFFNQWLDKKELNEKLETTLEPKHKEKKKKI